jgi:hypothetical protein
VARLDVRREPGRAGVFQSWNTLPLAVFVLALTRG